MCTDQNNNVEPQPDRSTWAGFALNVLHGWYERQIIMRIIAIRAVMLQRPTAARISPCSNLSKDSGSSGG